MYMSEEQLKETLAIRNDLDRPKRRYVYNQHVAATVEKRFHYVPRDLKVSRLMTDSITISDAYLLYAISMMGYASLRSIIAFLRTLENVEKKLSIVDMNGETAEVVDYVKNRMGSLKKTGFIIEIFYTVPNEQKSAPPLLMGLYTVDDETVRFMNQFLGKRVRADSWLVAKPLVEKIGIGACAHVGTWVAGIGNLLEYKEGLFKSKNLGVMHVPMELKLQSRITESIYYVGFCYAFLHHDKNRQTKADYQDSCVQKINLITNYFAFRRQRNPKEQSRMVVVVEDNNDLLKMGRLIYDTEVLMDELDVISFVGEGTCNSDMGQKKFLKMVLEPDEDAELPFDFIVDIPDFL